MKKIIFIISVFAVQLVWGQSSALKCEPINELVKNANQTKAVACEEINKNGRCKPGIHIDPNTMRNKIEADFKFSSNPETIVRLTKDWDSFIKTNPHFTKFYAVRNNLEIAQKKAPVPVLDWFSDPAFAPNTKATEEYKKDFIEKYVAFSQKYDCTPSFWSSAQLEPHPAIKGFTTEKMGREEKEYRLVQLKKELNDPKNIQMLADHMKKISESSLNNFLLCSIRPETDADGRPFGRYTSAERYPPCAGNFKQNFDNNKYDVTDPELSKLLETKEAQEVSACIKSRLVQGAKLHHISIVSSASALNNTKEAKKRFCEKGFLGLSEARAETARNEILPGLFNRAGQESFNFSKVKVDINALGVNGDGTSGDCPYEYKKNGQEVLKPYYNTKAGQDDLDKNRFVKVQVTFEDDKKQVTDSVLSYQPLYFCKKIEFKCE
ncbi:MAG: hypothetical protein H7235_02065 [Bdellovibrionaceae bacterium]|nr:hypothetical protein [Pseudobdellovibrionaceae bacterium]